MDNRLFPSAKDKGRAVAAGLVKAVLSGGDFSHLIEDFVSLRMTRNRMLRTLDASRSGEPVHVTTADAEAVAHIARDLLDELNQEFAADLDFSHRLLNAPAAGPAGFVKILEDTDAVRSARLHQFPPPGRDLSSSEGSRYLDAVLALIAKDLFEWVRDDPRFRERAALAHYADLRERTASVPAIREATDRATAEVIVAGYDRTIQERRPAQLMERDPELDQARAHAHGDASDYLIWVAPPKGGKSGLAYTIAADGFDETDVVPFFIRDHDRGRNNRETFIETTGAYLAKLVGRAYGPAPMDTNGGDLVWRNLLREAAQAVGERGRTLLVLVDGLDEDEALYTDHRRSSIAALLPTSDLCAAFGIRVLVTTRPNPPLPEDVARDHPLRSADVRHDLSVSPHASRAIDPREVSRLMADDLGRTIAGLLAVSGGPLTLADLSRFTGHGTERIRACLDGIQGRIILPVTTTLGQEGYELGHATAYEHVEDSLAGGGTLPSRDTARGMAARRALLREFASLIADAADDATTHLWLVPAPFLLTDSFVDLIRETNVRDREWLVDILSSPARRDAIEECAETVLPALQQLSALAAKIELDSHDAEEQVASLLLIRDSWRDRSLSLPASAVAAHAFLGQATVAIHLSTTLEHQEQVEALCEGILVGEGRAREMLIEAAKEAAQAMDPIVRATALVSLAHALARIPNSDRTEEAEALLQEATRLAQTNHFPEAGVGQLCDLAYERAERNDIDEAGRLIAEAEDLLRSAGLPLSLAQHMIIRVFARLGDAEGARSRIMHPPGRIPHIHDLVSIAAELTRARQAEDAQDAIAEALSMIDGIGGSVQTMLLMSIVDVQIALGDRAGARRSAFAALDATRRTSNAYDTTASLDSLVSALARLGEIDPALELVPSIPSSDEEFDALAAVATALLRAGRRERAFEIVGSFTADRSAISALLDFARALIEMGDRADVAALLSRVRKIASSAQNSPYPARVLLKIAKSAGTSDDPVTARSALHRAADRADRITDARSTVTVLGEVAAVSMKLGDVALATRSASSARQRAQEIERDSDRIEADADLCRMLRAIGETDDALDTLTHARATAARIHGDAERTRALRTIVKVDIETDALGDAVHDAQEIPDSDEAIRLFTNIADRFAAAGDSDATDRVYDLAIARTSAPLAARTHALVGTMIARHGDVEEAIAYIEGIRSPYHAATGLVGAAALLLDAGDRPHAEVVLEHAESIIATMDDSMESSARHLLAVQLDRAGAAARARKIVDTIPLSFERADALLDLARCAAAGGEEAMTVLADAERAAEESVPLELATAALVGIATLHAESGRFSEALRVAAKVPRSLDEALLLADLAARMRATGDDDTAVRTMTESTRVASEIPGSFDHTHALERLAESWRDAGASAQGLSHFLRDWQQRDEAPDLFAVAVLDPGLALRLAETID